MGLFFSIHNKFKLKNWARLNSGKRERILEKIEKMQAKKLGRPVLPVVINTKENCPYYGMFETCGEKQLLHLNVKLLVDPRLRFHALETIFPEGRHAYQYNVIKNKKLKFFEFKKKRWKQNYRGYITSSEDKLFYSMQPIERDAQKYAIKRLEKLRFRFKNEDDYFDTLDAMKGRFLDTEKQLKEKHGMFYNYHVSKEIRKKVSNRR